MFKQIFFLIMIINFTIQENRRNNISQLSISKSDQVEGIFLCRISQKLEEIILRTLRKWSEIKRKIYFVKENYKKKNNIFKKK